MPDFAVNVPGLNSALAAQGFDEDAAIKAYQATPEGQAALRAQTERDARLAAYKVANPNISDFQANFYSKTPEEQATFQAMYPGMAKANLKGQHYTGVAPEAGQSMFDYMLAHNGATPETKLNEGPGLGQALLNAALLAGGGVLTGGALNALMAGGGLGALFGGGAAGATAAGAPATAIGAGTSLVPTITAAGMVPTSTALGAGSAAGALGATLGTAGATGTLAALAPAAAGVGTSVEEVVIIGKLAAAGMSVPQIAAAVGLPALAVNSVLHGSLGLDVAQGGSGGDPVSQPTDVEEVVVNGVKPTPPPTLVPPVINPFQPGLTSTPNPTPDTAAPDEPEVSELEVTAAKPTPPPTLVPPVINPFQPGLTSTPNPTPDPVAPDEPEVSELEVVAPKTVDLPTLVPPIIDPGPLTSTPNPTPDTAAPDKKPPGMSWEDWLKLILTVTGAGGGAAAGGKKGPSTLPPGVMDAGQPGSTSSIFRSTLPPPSGPFANMSARNVSMTPEEWKTYGQRGQVAFLNSTPQRPSGIIDNSKRVDDTNMAPGTGFARGGFAVRGPGTGRSDDIPARLSDGEYVVDAETVSLLGDGSTKAGASKLDQFRVNIRKHKGRKLAKGAFSVDAKKPEAYLRGGQAR